MAVELRLQLHKSLAVAAETGALDMARRASWDGALAGVSRSPPSLF